ICVSAEKLHLRERFFRCPRKMALDPLSPSFRALHAMKEQIIAVQEARPTCHFSSLDDVRVFSPTFSVIDR
ncbi:hypothetical protein, partial [Lactiplantibacillus pentosus]